MIDMTRKKRGQKTNTDRPAIRAKAAEVEKIVAELKTAKVIAVLDVRALPDRFLQSARKKLRGHAKFFVAKNSVIIRAIQKSKKGEKLLELIKTPTCLVTADIAPYQLFKFFKDNKGKVAAKPGQIADVDIVVPEGETDLLPGPALSELKAGGINAQIRAGKIVIAKESVVAKAGTKISDGVCKALQKLNVMPFEVGVRMLAAFDGEMYMAAVLDIDEKKLGEDLLQSFRDAFNLSMNASVPTSANIDMLLIGAIDQAKNIALNGKLISDSSIEMLLQQAVREGTALEPVGASATPAAESKPSG